VVETRNFDEAKEEGGAGGMGVTKPHNLGMVVRAKRRRGGRKGWKAHLPLPPPPLEGW